MSKLETLSATVCVHEPMRNSLCHCLCSWDNQELSLSLCSFTNTVGANQCHRLCSFTHYKPIGKSQMDRVAGAQTELGPYLSSVLRFILIDQVHQEEPAEEGGRGAAECVKRDQAWRCPSRPGRDVQGLTAGSSVSGWAWVTGVSLL